MSNHTRSRSLMVCLVAMIIMLLDFRLAHPQGYVLEFESPSGLGLGFVTSFYGPDFVWTNDRLDMEGDGVLELITYDETNDGIYVYDGRTHVLKWTRGLALNEGANIFRGFYDIDADGEREAVFDDDGAGVGKIRVVDLQTGGIEFSLDTCVYTCVLDIDNDSSPELVVENRQGGGKRVQIWGAGGPNSIISETGNQPPEDHRLYPNYPNPFNSSTTIEFDVQEPGLVSIDIYNINAQLVRTLVNTPKPIGAHSTTWDGRDKRGRPVSSGMYFYRLRTGDFVSSKKMIVLK